MNIIGIFILVLFLDGGVRKDSLVIYGFQTKQLCEQAASELKAKPNTFQCIRAKN